MDVRRSNWDESDFNSNEGNDGREASTLGDSTRALVQPNTPRILQNRKNKLALVTFALVCAIGIVISTGYIYVQHNFAHEIISRHDVEVVNEDGDIVPYAEAHTAIFVESDDRNGNSSSITLTSNGTFDPNTTVRTLPSDPYGKPPVSLLLELVVRPKPVFTYFECPIKRPSKFYRLNITIGSGTGVLGFGTGKKSARKMAAEVALRYLYTNDTFTFPEPDYPALTLRCGTS